jgi:hypothetical protein
VLGRRLELLLLGRGTVEGRKRGSHGLARYRPGNCRAACRSGSY